MRRKEAEVWVACVPVCVCVYVHAHAPLTGLRRHWPGLGCLDGEGEAWGGQQGRGGAGGCLRARIQVPGRVWGRCERG